MGRRGGIRAVDAARVVGVGVVVGGVAPWASASFSAFAKATATSVGTDTDESTTFTGSATAEKENLRGGHGYGYANVDFLGGSAATFGASTPDGVHLQWNGMDWMGSCDDSAALIPPNPIEPTPGALGALGIASIGAARRKR